MLADEIMTAQVVTTMPDASVREAIGLVLHHRVAALPVLDAKDELVGIVSELDLLRDRVQPDPRAHLGRLPSAGRPLAHTVAEVMTTAVHAVPLGTDAAAAAEVLARTGVRSLPVVRGPHVVGIIGRRDLLRHLVRTDAALAVDVARALADQPYVGTWQVEVTDGEVHLSDGAQEKTDVAVTVARTVPGVVRVSAKAKDAP